MNDAVKEALARVKNEERRLADELEKVQAVRRALERQLGVGPGAEKLSRINVAPPRALEDAIKAVLRRGAVMSRAEIIAAIKRTDYAYSLTPLHVTKTLIRLLRAKAVCRTGDRPAVKYRRA